jgi:hypothetical protein
MAIPDEFYLALNCIAEGRVVKLFSAAMHAFNYSFPVCVPPAGHDPATFT